MVAQYTADELKRILRQGTYHLVAEGSFEHFSTRKLSKHLGLSDPYIYRCYKSTHELLMDCFIVFDRRIAANLEKTIRRLDPALTTKEKIRAYCSEIWMDYWNFLLTHEKETIYHWRFLNSGYYTNEVYADRQKYYRALIHFILYLDRKYQVSQEVNLRLLTDNLVLDTILNAVRVITGEMEDTEQNRRTVFDMAFSPVYWQLYEKSATPQKNEQYHEQNDEVKGN